MSSFYKEKVVSAREMARIEKKSFEDGQSPERYMTAAGLGIATRVEVYIEAHELKRQVSLLVGKGNNGGDAFTAGIVLLEHGYEVNAFHLFPFEECAPLCQEKGRLFKEAGGEIYYPTSLEEIALYKKGLVLDGILGTGFTGATRGFLSEVIEYVNAQDYTVLAIDVPSGVNGNTGEVEGEAIIADETIYLGLPKCGILFGDGYAYSGHRSGVDFGMPSSYIDDATSICATFNESIVSELLPTPHPLQHKYSAGYVVCIGGSHGMSGAAFLSTYAALRSGAGIVRLFYDTTMENELSGKPWEVIAEPFSTHRVEKELERAGALVIGPGLPLTNEMHSVLTRAKVPTVVDASLLQSVKPILSRCTQPILLTPHKGELQYLVDIEGASELEVLEKCQSFVDEEGVYLLVKGAPTLFFQKGKDPLVLPVGNPGMATAGTGDVLSGILGSLLAQGLLPKEAGPVGAVLHGRAGDLAMIETGELSLCAKDLIKKVPEAILSFST